jgi:hypothetical protein
MVIYFRGAKANSYLKKKREQRYCSLIVNMVRLTGVEPVTPSVSS